MARRKMPEGQKHSTSTWTDEEMVFLRANITALGTVECAKRLNKPRPLVYGMAVRNSLIQIQAFRSPKSPAHSIVSGSFFAITRHEARKRRKPFNVTIEDLATIFEKQNGRCALSGVPIKISRSTEINGDRTTASLDRIDSFRGYEVDNCQFIHKIVNVMKNSLSDEEFIEWCRLIANNNKGITCSALTSVRRPTTIMPIVKCSISSPMSLDTFRHQVKKQIPELSSTR